MCEQICKRDCSWVIITKFKSYVIYITKIMLIFILLITIIKTFYLVTQRSYIFLQQKEVRKGETQSCDFAAGISGCKDVESSDGKPRILQKSTWGTRDGGIQNLWNFSKQ